jgi:hypothetical protein
MAAKIAILFRLWFEFTTIIIELLFHADSITARRNILHHV